MQKSTVQKNLMNEKTTSDNVNITKKRRSALSIMGSLIGLVKPLIHIMLAAIILGTAGYLCTITCPAKIVRKIAHKYPAVPRMIAASII